VPVFAKVIFEGNAATYGYISSFMGFGAILGSLFFAGLKKGTNLRAVILLSTCLLGIGLIIFSRIGYFTLAMPFAVLIGFGSLMPMTASITAIQMEAATHMRGRVMSYMAMSFFGMLPLGSLLIGAVSQRIGAPLSMLCQGVSALIIAACFSGFLRSSQIKLKETII
jgi:MFS family permease